MNDTGLVVGVDIFDEIIEESKKCIIKNNKNYTLIINIWLVYFA